MARVRLPQISLLVALVALAGCEFAPPPTAPGASTGPGAAGGAAQTGPIPLDAPEPAAPAARPIYGAFRPATVPDVAVTPYAVKTVPKAGGNTFADLLKDDSALDDFEPEVPVIFSAPGYGEGLTAPNGKMKVRGKSTRANKLKSFRIELQKEAPRFRDQLDVLVNKHPYDDTRMRNKLMFDLVKGLPEFVAPETWFATLTVDGQPQGFYTQIERVDKRFLARRKLDDKGYLYKAEFFEFDRYADALKKEGEPGYDKKAFEKHLQIEGATDHTKVLAMIDAVNDAKTPINAVIDKHFDRANYVTWLAMNIVTDNLDTNSQNFLLYSPVGDGPWRFIPWDYDGAWGYYDQEGEAGREARTARWQTSASNYWGVALHRRFLKDPANVAMLTERVDQLAGQFFTAARIASHLDAYKPVVGAAIAQSPDKEAYRAEGGANAASAWAAQVVRMTSVVEASRKRYHDGLGRPMPVFIGDGERRAAGWRLAWGGSYDLQGDALTYEVKVARDPGLKDVVFEQAGLTATEAVAPLQPGTYYVGVVIRDAKGEWQIAFDKERVGEVTYDGVKRIEVK